MRLLILVIFLFVALSNIFSQGRSLFTEFATSHFARSVAMGDAYTGIAEGVESAYLNSAGLAFENQYGIIWGNGKGLTYMWGDISDFNIALSIPVKFLEGNISACYFHQEFDYMGRDLSSLFKISYSRELFKNFALGLGFSHYHSKMVTSDLSGTMEASGNSFGLSLSSLYRLAELNIVTPSDEIRIGAVLTNITSSEFYYFDEAQADPIVQQFRVGISYSAKPEIYWQNLRLLRIMIAAAGNFKLTKYEFDNWNPNWGAELTILEVVSLRYGRENFQNLINPGSTTLQFPVTRYGFGIQVPINTIFPITEDVKLSFDMVFSKWNKEKLFGEYSRGHKHSIQDSFMSLQVQYGIK